MSDTRELERRLAAAATADDVVDELCTVAGAFVIVYYRVSGWFTVGYRSIGIR